MGAPDRDREEARARLAREGVAILFEDNHVLAVAKPAGLLSQGGPTGEVSLVDLVDRYRRKAEAKPGRAFVGLVHRLDRNVSGCLVLGKTSKAASRLAAAFAARDGVEKRYLAWVQGTPTPAEGTWTDVLRRDGGVTRVTTSDDPEGKEARLAYAVAATRRGTSRLEIELLTGRTHQIRAQCAHHGHPLLGDTKYGGPPGERPALHAWRLAFPHPIGGRRVEVEAPIPDKLARL